MKYPLLFLAILLSPISAQAAKLSLVGGMNFSTPEKNPAGPDYQAAEAFGGGVLLEMGMIPAIGFEFGALYLPRKFDYTAGTAQSTEFNTVQVPLLLRATLGGVLSLGVGGYYAFYPKTPVVKDSLGVPMGHEDSDYGVATSVALYIPVSKLSRFLIDGRYNIGAKDNWKGPGSLKYNDLQILVGLQFGM